MGDQRDKAASIFDGAVELGTAADRAAYLDAACGDDAHLRAEVEGLLDHDNAAGSFLNLSARPNPQATIDEPPVSERAGTVIGPYKLLEQIGEGGFGVVFMAEQQEPIRRKVALKVLKPGMDTRQVVARFEAERQALALMDHPNIAKVLEAGETASGRPYFVMDLVKGLAITEYCDQAQLTPRERLELFVNVCQAVQHAHQKGIIHRDIKPSNVLVTLHDGSPLVKVIDFGIAKALGQQLTDKTLFTGFAQMIGTPLYMAPEQAALSNVDVDTRSDIYSLGVLLYELLTGTTPFDKERFKEAGYDEMRRIIREEEPPRPSTRISTMGQAATSVSTQRKSDPKRLSQLLHGELDWIVMKCLEKDRNRRYETANSLARDIERYLHDEPVQACPPSALYRLRKFARRNKRVLAPVVAAAAAVFVGLLLTVVLLVSHAVEMKEEQQRTGKEYDRAEAALRQAKGNLQRADQNLTLALEALDDVYMKDVEDRILRDRRMTKVERESLEKGLKFYERFARQNSGHAELERVKAKAYRRAGFLRLDLKDWPEARAQFAKAIGVFEKSAGKSKDSVEDRQELARCCYGTTLGLRNAGRHREAQPFSRRAIALWEKLAADFPQVPNYRVEIGHCFWQLAGALSSTQQHENAEKAAWQALRLFEALAAEYPREPFYRQETGASHRQLGDRLHAAGRTRQAAESFKKAVLVYADLVGQAPHNSFYRAELAHTYNGLGGLLREGQRLREGEEAYRLAIRQWEQLVAESPTAEHRHQLGESYSHLGYLLTNAQRLKDAEEAYRTCLDIVEKAVAESPNLYIISRLAISSYELGQLLRRTGRRGQADQLYRRAVATCRAALARHEKSAADHHLRDNRWHYASDLEHIGRLLKQLGETAEAEEAYRNAQAIWIKLVADFNLEDDRGHLGGNYEALGQLLTEARRPDEAAAAYRAGLAVWEKLVADFNKRDHRGHLYWSAYRDLRTLLENRGRNEAAIQLCRQTIDFYEKLAGRYPNDLSIKLTCARQYRDLGKGLQETGKTKEGEEASRRSRALYEEVAAAYRKSLERNPKDIRAHNNLGVVLFDQGKENQAIPEYRAAVNLKPNDAGFHHNLGTAYSRLAKFDEAGAAIRKVIELDPNNAQAHSDLGAVYCMLGKLNQAVAEFRTAIDLKPNDAAFHYNLGCALQGQGKLNEAIPEYRTTIGLKPHYAEAHCNLGIALVGKGDFVQALTYLKRGHELGSRNPSWPYPSARWLEHCERLVRLGSRVPRILAGEKAIADGRERIAVGFLCSSRQQYELATRCYEEALAQEPGLAEDLKSGDRYDAACSAALASIGAGRDTPALRNEQRARRRRQALNWLRADLRQHVRALENAAPAARAATARKLDAWLRDADLRGLREAAYLAKLPAEEREKHVKFWTEVRELLGKAQSKK